MVVGLGVLLVCFFILNVVGIECVVLGDWLCVVVLWFLVVIELF